MMMVPSMMLMALTAYIEFRLADEADRDLRVFTSKWVGDDVRIKFRECGMDPDHSKIMTEYGLKPGDRPGTDLYPRIWQSIESA